MYFEIGANDHRYDIYDFLQHPDHTVATILGFRKYNFFNNENLIRYRIYNLRRTRFDNRPTPNWYNRSWFGLQSIRWKKVYTHSGADSDDLYLYFGYFKASDKMILSFDYETMVFQKVLILVSRKINFLFQNLN